MFSIFSKKNMDKEAAKAFWKWFEAQEKWIVECTSNHDSAFVWEIDERLKHVFPYFRGELEFQLGYNNGVGEFFFYHFGKPEHVRDAQTLREMMPLTLSKTWNFILEK